MSTGVVAAIVVVVLVVIAVVAVLAARGGASAGRLKHRFGPEYDRSLARHQGDEKAARKELAARVQRFGTLERKALPSAERDRYTDRWGAVQAHFVEEPAAAVAEADRLIAELATDRGFPEAGSPEHFDALSVHHAHHVQGYRQAHALTEHAHAGGQGATEDLRQALVAARHLFRELLADDGKAPGGNGPAPSAKSEAREPSVAPATSGASGADTSATAPARTASDTDTDVKHGGPDDEKAAPPEHRSLSARFAALTGSGRKDHADA